MAQLLKLIMMRLIRLSLVVVCGVAISIIIVMVLQQIN